MTPANPCASLPFDPDLGSGFNPARDFDFNFSTSLPFQHPLGSVKCLLEAHLQGMFKVPSLLRTRFMIELLPAYATAGLLPVCSAEQILEEIGEATTGTKQFFKIFRVDRPIRIGPTLRSSSLTPVKILWPPPCSLILLPLGTELIVLLTFFRIGQYFVGLVDVLKFRCSFGVTRVDVRMIFSGQLAIGFFDVLRAGFAVHP